MRRAFPIMEKSIKSLASKIASAFDLPARMAASYTASRFAFSMASPTERYFSQAPANRSLASMAEVIRLRSYLAICSGVMPFLRNARRMLLAIDSVSFMYPPMKLPPAKSISSVPPSSRHVFLIPRSESRPNLNPFLSIVHACIASRIKLRSIKSGIAVTVAVSRRFAARAKPSPG